MKEKIKTTIQESIAVKSAVLADALLLAEIEKVTDLMVVAFRAGKKILFCGNGGSAADAQHLSSELSGRFFLNRPSLYSEALHVNGSAITAIGNDFDFSEIYARQLEGMGKEGDVLVAISTSGNSENIIKAVQMAQQKGMTCIGMTGASGGELINITDHCLKVPSTITPRIQESHILIGHIICEAIEARMFAK